MVYEHPRLRRWRGGQAEYVGSVISGDEESLRGRLWGACLYVHAHVFTLRSPAVEPVAPVDRPLRSRKGWWGHRADGGAAAAAAA